MNREAIYSALFNRLSAIQGFKTTSRRLKHWDAVKPIEQPAMFVVQTKEFAQTTAALETKWVLGLDIYIYANTGKGLVGPVINPLVDAVCNELNKKHPVTGRPMLDAEGVEAMMVDGQIDTDEGTLGDQAVVIIPVQILAT